ncbi:MAG: threonine/serine dehydratase [Planctomycetes bacterium]|nr:threonine/serine dehydratase [Planctomycetota bacterium]MCB9888447.1 threonine/serine dehydratase [Planctomycetota bacterium]
MDIRGAVLDAHRRIASHVRHTPLEPAPALTRARGCHAFLKLENLQHTGSFKLRGAMNKLLALDPPARLGGVVAASTGNHGAAVAYGARQLGVPATIFAPCSAQPNKLDVIRRLGAEVCTVGDDCLAAEVAARTHAHQHGATYVSPYNDPAVIAGQGTIGRELELDLPELDAVIVAVGGGGLAAGVGGYLKAIRPQITVVGASPRASAAMHASLAAGRVVEVVSTPTLSDGTAGGIEPDSITLGLCRSALDELVLVEEDEIAAAVEATIDAQHTLIEGAAGAAVAAFWRGGDRWDGKRVAVVVCGGNIAAQTLRQVLCRT